MNSSIESVPRFVAFADGSGHNNLRAAISDDVKTERPLPAGVFGPMGVFAGFNFPTPCAGVALQRLWLLRQGYVPDASIWQQVGSASEGFAGPGNGAVIATDFVTWLQQDGFSAFQSFKEGRTCEDDFHAGMNCLGYDQNKALVVILNGEHWVTVIGRKNGIVYVLDYAGVIAVPYDTFAAHVGGNASAPGSVVVVGWN